jgi:hypothetical protein
VQGALTTTSEGFGVHWQKGSNPHRGILTITATHIAYAGDSCDGHPMLRLKTDCEVQQTTIGSRNLGGIRETCRIWFTNKSLT